MIRDLAILLFTVVFDIAVTIITINKKCWLSSTENMFPWGVSLRCLGGLKMAVMTAST